MQVAYAGTIHEPSRTTAWRHRTGRTSPRPLPAGHDPAWCREHEAAIWDCARTGARQAEAFAFRSWDIGRDRYDHEELVAVGLMAICSVSAHANRDIGGWRVTVARCAVQSWLRQHVIGQRRSGALGVDVREKPSNIENAPELVALLRQSYPGEHWRRWRQHPEQTGAALRELLEGTGHHDDA